MLGISLLMLCCFDICTSSAFLKQNVATVIPHNQQYQAKHIRSIKHIPRGGGTAGQHLGSNNASELSIIPAEGYGFDDAPLHQSQWIFLGTNALRFLISLFANYRKHIDLLGTRAFALASLRTSLSSSCT
eukprot:317185_1